VRIARLDLHAFGPFTNARLSFDHKPRALQLVYGPNEAGKSTTLRALIALLYGIPVRTGDAHVHEMGKLRVGGVLLDEAGKRHELMRRKGMKHTLLGPDDKPLLEDALVRMLGGLDENLFRQMFGLDHERLRHGAEALLSGGGRVGEGLFDAGTGARAIRLAMESLAREAESLFKVKGRTPRLNAAIEQLKEHHKAQRDAALSPQAFLEQERGLTEARAARELAVKSRRGLYEEKAQLERAIALFPLLVRHAQLTAALAELGGFDAGGDAVLESEHERLLARHQASRRAADELPRERTRAELIQHEIAALRARVLSAGELSSAIDTPTRTRLRKLGEMHKALTREHEQLTRSSVEQAALVENLGAKLSPSGNAGPAAELGVLMERLLREAPEQTWLSLGREVAEAEAALQLKARQLGVEADALALARRRLPDESELLELDKRGSDWEQEHRAQGVRLRSLDERHLAVTRARQQLLLDGQLASLDDLREAREARQLAYQALLQGSHGEPAPAEITRDLAQADQALRADFEAQVRRADELADRLRREAQRAAEMSRLDQELRALEHDRGELKAAQQNVERQLSGLAQRVRELSVELGLPELSRRELRAKLVKLSALVEQATSCVARRAARAAAESRVAELAAQLARALEPGRAEMPLLELPSAALEHLGRLRAQAQAQLDAEERARQARDKAHQRWEEASLTRAATVARTQAVVQELAQVTESYRAEAARLGLASELSLDEALSSLEELVELELKTRELLKVESAMAATERELTALSSDVLGFAERMAPLGEALPAHDVGATLERLGSVLRARRETSRQRDEGLRELAKLREQLLQGGDGASLQELEQRLRGLEPDRARVRLLEIEGELEALDAEIGALSQTIGSKEAGLSLLEQPSSAVSLAEEVQADLSNVRTLSRRYLELRLSQTLLKREVDLYRTRHQGPVLSRANELFPRLTLSRYRGLDVEYDERDEAVLCAVRKDGKTVRVSGMSDGTRDQLYLALRVASIERFLANNPPLPLILDDAFVHFDDQRAEAALRVLAELCDQTQVLFFTHHRRMVDLARDALGRDRMVLHELDPARGVINLRDDGPLFAGL
jgi:uncharacterized protein YhaN